MTVKSTTDAPDPYEGVGGCYVVDPTSGRRVQIVAPPSLAAATPTTEAIAASATETEQAKVQAMNEKPLEKALLTLRPDLTLQLAAGDRAHDVQLDVAGAYGLAGALLATIGDLVPWAGRADADLIERIHTLGFSAVRMADIALRRQPIADEPRALVSPSLDAAFAILTLLADETETPQ